MLVNSANCISTCNMLVASFQDCAMIVEYSEDGLKVVEKLDIQNS